MLRSLVGSEMCIRDSRLTQAVAGGDEDHILEARLGVDGEHHAGRAEVGTCLLYTSDAADDLLCVDLGGRRIIKKKKNDTTHSIYTILSTPTTSIQVL